MSIVTPTSALATHFQKATLSSPFPPGPFNFVELAEFAESGSRRRTYQSAEIAASDENVGYVAPAKRSKAAGRTVSEAQERDVLTDQQQHHADQQQRQATALRVYQRTSKPSKPQHGSTSGPVLEHRAPLQEISGNVLAALAAPVGSSSALLPCGQHQQHHQPLQQPQQQQPYDPFEFPDTESPAPKCKAGSAAAARSAGPEARPPSRRPRPASASAAVRLASSRPAGFLPQAPSLAPLATAGQRAAGETDGAPPRFVPDPMLCTDERLDDSQSELHGPGPAAAACAFRAAHLDEDDEEEDAAAAAAACSLVWLSAPGTERGPAVPHRSGRSGDGTRPVSGHFGPCAADTEELWARERLYRPDPNLLRGQEQITAKSRLVLLDWLIEVCEELGLHRETYHLAVNFVDRVLDRVRHIHRSKLQLLGIAAMSVACKVEEIKPPPAQQFVNLTDDTYTLRQLRRMEQFVLAKLNWRLCPVTVNTWALRYVIAAHRLQNGSSTSSTVGVSEYCARCHVHRRECLHQVDTALFGRMMAALDLAMLDPAALRFPPSQLAAAVYWLLRRSQPPTADELYRITGYGPDALLACAQWVQPYAEAGPRKTSGYKLRCKLAAEVFTMQVHHPDAMGLVESRWYREGVPS